MFTIRTTRSASNEEPSSALVPRLALAPVIIFYVGGFQAKYFISARVAFFPMLINVMKGLGDLNEDLDHLLASPDASLYQEYRKVRFLNLLSFLFDEMKLTVTLAIVGAVVDEYVTADSGMGWFALFALRNLDTRSCLGSAGSRGPSPSPCLRPVHPSGPARSLDGSEHDNRVKTMATNNTAIEGHKDRTGYQSTYVVSSLEIVSPSVSSYSSHFGSSIVGSSMSGRTSTSQSHVRGGTDVPLSGRSHRRIPDDARRGISGVRTRHFFSIGLGIVLSKSYLIRQGTLSMLVYFYSLPHAIVAPLFIVWFSNGLVGIGLFVAWFAFSRYLLTR